MPFSIVIPAFNEELYIAETVETLFKLLKGRIDFDLIVIDNASTDATADILSRFDGISVIRLPGKVTVAAARNIGWHLAKSNLVAFIDADMIITEQWVAEVEKLLRTHLDQSLIITGCKCLPARNPSWLESVWFNNANYRNSTEKYINSGNLITTKQVLQAIAGFDESLITGEDVDFCLRAKKAGASLDVNSNFKIYHEGYPKTLKSFIKRERWHGVGDFLTFQHFINSKVAICSLLVSFFLCLALLLLLSGSAYFIFALAVSLGLIVLTSHYKFKVVGMGLWLKIYFLQMCYFIGRTMSLMIRKKI